MKEGSLIIGILELFRITGPDHDRKEAVKQHLQDMLEASIKSGEVTSQEELDDWWHVIEVSTRAMRVVPYSAWKRNVG